MILCERGIRTFETHTRNTLDLAAVPLLHQLTHLPVVVDPSHATGKRWLVTPLAASGRPRSAPTASSSRSTRGPTRRSPTATSRVTLAQFAELAAAVRPIHGPPAQGRPDVLAPDVLRVGGDSH